MVILIHTSVKLVTYCLVSPCRRTGHFNPHEREARDGCVCGFRAPSRNFNPHEREARDDIYGEVAKATIDFNPHEREARDSVGQPVDPEGLILIHTSVKLVTSTASETMSFSAF